MKVIIIGDMTARRNSYLASLASEYQAKKSVEIISVDNNRVKEVFEPEFFDVIKKFEEMTQIEHINCYTYDTTRELFKPELEQFKMMKKHFNHLKTPIPKMLNLAKNAAVRIRGNMIRK